ncbi:hypothetical protein DASC09_047430 [Saccharomycopsis crataegensis]|uniref:Secreted protein n=1 Tax=Saccharomycopsis crataegensis TaxID=43959 RepID=A0AAV5QRK0_9ASCO|nr:hypothetical protein DASC09_047430 [Saccharomycopsis crataegensis]
MMMSTETHTVVVLVGLVSSGILLDGSSSTFGSLVESTVLVGTSTGGFRRCLGLVESTVLVSTSAGGVRRCLGLVESTVLVGTGGGGDGSGSVGWANSGDDFDVRSSEVTVLTLGIRQS